jgi:hypothetical protein
MDPQPAPSDALPGAPAASALTGGDAAARAEARVVMLGRLAEMAFEAAAEIREALRAVHAENAAERAGEAAPAAAQPVDGAAATRPVAQAPVKPSARKRDIPELALALARTLRAARMACALQAALEPGKPAEAAGPAQTNFTVRFVDGATGEELHKPGFSSAAPAEPHLTASERAAAEAVEARARKGDALGVVRRLAAASLLPGEFSPRDAAEIVERSVREAAERLEAENDFASLMRRPFSEIVDHICRDLGLRPDWSRLAEEEWAKAELAGDAVGEPLAPFKPARREAEPNPPRPPQRWPPREPPS